MNKYKPKIEKERRHRRIPLTANVMLLAGELDLPMVRHATIADISLGGVGIYLVFPLGVGVRVKLEIRFMATGGIKTETVKGKTIYSYRIENTYYVGIEFDQQLNLLHHPKLFTHIENTLNRRMKRKAPMPESREWPSLL
jgi:hypothetical protein